MTIAINGDTKTLTQWDVGREVTCDTEAVRFFISRAATAYEVEAEDGVAAVPDEVLQHSGQLVCFGVDDGVAVESARFPVTSCAKPVGYVFTETNRATIDDVQAALEASLAEVEETLTAAAEAAQDTADVALHSASGYCESTSGYAKLGRNLATAFADEIGDEEPITWLHDRAAAGDFEGLAVGDYLTVTLNDSSSTTMAYQLAGFDMYYGVGDTPNGHHVTMVPAIVYPEYVVWNETGTDQGTEDEPSPWLSSYLYSWMNTTFLAYLPEEWQAALVELRLLLPTRYSSSGSLTDDSGYEWASPGAVWAPSEREVWGDVRRGTMSTSIPSTDRQLPLFQRSSVARSRYIWWERSAASGSSTHACYIGGDGGASANSATYASVWPLPCFHVG